MTWARMMPVMLRPMRRMGTRRMRRLRRGIQQRRAPRISHVSNLQLSHKQSIASLYLECVINAYIYRNSKV